MNTQKEQQQIAAEARRIFEKDARTGEAFLDDGTLVPTWDALPKMTQETYCQIAAEQIQFSTPIPQEVA